MTSYRRQFLANSFACVLLILLSGSQMALQVAQQETANPIVYTLWVFIWTVSCAIGIDMVKEVWAYEKDEWLEEQVGPILLEGGI